MGNQGVGPIGAPQYAPLRLLVAGNTDFADSATKTLGWKSGSLKQLITAITNYQNNLSEDRLREVNHRLISWMAENPKESKSANRGSNALALSQEVLQIARERQWRLWHSPAGLISDVIGELNRCKTFACTDVGTFAGDINQALPRARRDAIYNRGTQLGRSTGRPIIPTGNVGAGAWDPDGLRAAYDRVYGASAGECTSFAKAAAHVLTAVRGRYVMPRIEIVSYRNQRLSPRFNRDRTPMFLRDANGNVTNHQAMERQYVTHVFCVVGRAGQDVLDDPLLGDAVQARGRGAWIAALSTAGWGLWVTNVRSR